MNSAIIKSYSQLGGVTPDQFVNRIFNQSKIDGIFESFLAKIIDDGGFDALAQRTLMRL